MISFPPPFIVPPRRPPPTLQASMAANNPQQTDPPKKKVVVCGGGVIGVCTAYFLSKRGAAVTLVEQSSIACAASGKAGGFLALDWCDGGPVEALARASFDLHRTLAGELNGRESYGYRPLDTLSLSVAESETPPRRRKTAAPPWVDGPATAVKAIGTPATTAQVHPGLFTRRVMEEAVAEYGAEVVVGKLVGVECGGGTVAVAVEGGGVIGGDAVVLALGPWSGEVYVCGMSSEEEVPDDPSQIEPNPDSIQVLKRVAATVSSHLGEDARVTTEQACFLPCTDDSVPVIGEIPGMTGCFVATGHSCWGILNGPATGAAMAELVIDGCSTIVDLTQFSPARFVGG